MQTGLQPGRLAAAALGVTLLALNAAQPVRALPPGEADAAAARVLAPLMPLARATHPGVQFAAGQEPLFPAPAPYTAPVLVAPQPPQPVRVQPVPVQPVAVQPVPVQPVAVQPVPAQPVAVPAPVPQVLPPAQVQQVPVQTQPVPQQAAVPVVGAAPVLPPQPVARVPVAPAPVVEALVPRVPVQVPAIGSVTNMQPLAHARNAGVAHCLDSLARASTIAIDGEHEAFSTWATSAPDVHVFQSIAMMRYPNQVAPRSASILLVAPTAANGCEGGTVQVVPTARSCAAIQAQLLQGGKVIVNLSGLPLIENAAGVRQLLLPAAGNGCVMVSIGIIAGAAPQ